MTEYWYLRSALLEYMMTEDPLGANPYLCVSHLQITGLLVIDEGIRGGTNEMELTPGTRKSNGSTGYPARSRKGMRKEPRQQSTCKPSPNLIASRPKLVTSVPHS